MTSALYQLPAHQQIAEPSLKFHPDRPEDIHAHPLEGLRRFGPYSRKVFGAVADPIRVAVVAPADGVNAAKALVAELERRYPPKERRAYLIDFTGFSSTFGVRAVVAESLIITLPSNIDTGEASGKPYAALADHLTRAINGLRAKRSEFDVVLIYLPTRWSQAFTGGVGDDFDLHDYIKGLTASANTPAQIVREDGALDYFCRCSVMWRLSIALYCKAGGIPWKLAHVDPSTAYVGLGYAIRTPGEEEQKFVTCCSQVFDAEGTGLEFIGYETGDVELEGENPYLSRNDMQRVMSRSLSLYQQQHGGKLPRCVVVHKMNPFKPHEVDGCFDALRAVERVELVQIQGHSLWRGVHLDPPRAKTNERSRPGYAVRRGSYLILGGSEALLWTQGNVPQANNQNFFKEMKGTPSPLLIRRFAGQGPFSEVCTGILGLSKMDWNNDALYNRMPVTVSYAKVLADTLKRIGRLNSRPYPFRLFM